MIEKALRGLFSWRHLALRRGIVTRPSLTRLTRLTGMSTLDPPWRSGQLGVGRQRAHQHQQAGGGRADRDIGHLTGVSVARCTSAITTDRAGR